jgi:hypothetical protein
MEEIPQTGVSSVNFDDFANMLSKENSISTFEMGTARVGSGYK